MLSMQQLFEMAESLLHGHGFTQFWSIIQEWRRLSTNDTFNDGRNRHVAVHCKFTVLSTFVKYRAAKRYEINILQF